MSALPDLSPGADIWTVLHDRAVALSRGAYVPYSKYPVGAAALVDDGRIVSGCNVENAAYGVGLCAECGLVSDLAASGGGRLVAFTCVDGNGEILVPCGRCRQLLQEFGGPALRMRMPSGYTTLASVLPEAFGPDHLTDYAASGDPRAASATDDPAPSDPASSTSSTASGKDDL